MSFGSSFDAKELVRQAVDIVELVGKYIPLRRQGRMYVGLCPWHDDTRPSLQVNPERQSFKCWVCDIGGDVFSFLMKIEGVSFPEALHMLAEQAGITLKPAPGSARGPSDHAGDKRVLYQAMAWAEAQYHECLLHTPEAEPARRYLHQRSITAESMSKFRLGFSPERRDWLLGRAQGTRFDARLLETIGILARPMTGVGVYDRFKGRVVFPIRDAQGRPVGIGARLLPDSGSTSPAKYVNTPETPLFSKSNLLYGLDAARDAMRKSRTALVMEGYTDCIVAHQYGFQDAVAVLGTALGNRHVQILKRFADRIVLVLDGDAAGQRGTNEVLELFVAEKVDLRILTLPENLDPCDFLHQYGAAAFSEMLAHEAVDALEHAFRSATRGLDLAHDVHGASEALERLVAIVAKAPRLRADTTREDRFREEKILQRLAASFRVPEKDVRDRLTALRRAARHRAEPFGAVQPAPPGANSADALASRRAGARIESFERELLEVLLRHPEHVAALASQIRPEHLPSESCRRIYQSCCRLSSLGQTPTFQRLMVEFDEPAIKSLLVELDESGLAKDIGEPETLLEELIKTYRRLQTSKQLPAVTGALRQTELDEGEKLTLLAQFVQQQRARHGISGPTEG